MLGGRSGFRAFWRLWWYKTGLIIEILSLFIHLQSCLGACWERLGSSTWEHPPWVPGSQSRALSSWHTHGARTDSEHTSSVIHLQLTCSESADVARDTRRGLLVLLLCRVVCPPFLQRHYKSQLLTTEENFKKKKLRGKVGADCRRSFQVPSSHMKPMTK